MPDKDGNCHNCGKPGQHYVQPGEVGMKGYYVCKPSRRAAQ